MDIIMEVLQFYFYDPFFQYALKKTKSRNLAIALAVVGSFSMAIAAMITLIGAIYLIQKYSFR